MQRIAWPFGLAMTDLTRFAIAPHLTQPLSCVYYTLRWHTPRQTITVPEHGDRQAGLLPVLAFLLPQRKEYMSDKIVYFDCFSGASGNMLLGALLDAGLPLDELQADLDKLGLTGYHLHVERQVKQGISGTYLDVDDTGQEHPVRNLDSVRRILQASTLSSAVQARSEAVFTRLAEAEARVHGVAIEEVHFHEIGAVDTLVDIVGVVSALERLGIGQVYASPLPTGKGSVKTQHGRLPLPAPATLALLAAVGAPLLPSPIDVELVTPTGAALLAELATFVQPAMRIRAVGYGLGKKDLPWANVLRVWIGEPLPVAGEIHVHDQHHNHEHHGDS